MAFGQAVSFDVPRLLPYLYRRFLLQVHTFHFLCIALTFACVGQDLEEQGQQLMEETHMRRLNSMSKAVKQAETEQLVWHEADMQKAVAELEDLERGLRITSRIERA